MQIEISSAVSLSVKLYFLFHKSVFVAVNV